MHSNEQSKKTNKIKAQTWNVYPDSSFWRHPAHSRPCQEYPVQKIFYWDSEEWMIPSVYASACKAADNSIQPAGIVIDFIKKIPAKSIRQFINKWNLHPDSGCDDFSEEQLTMIENDNPLIADLTPIITLNGSDLTKASSSSISWNPIYPEMNDKAIRDALAHYRLDPAYGWTICRYFFPCQNHGTEDTDAAQCRTDTGHAQCRINTGHAQCRINTGHAPHQIAPAQSRISHPAAADSLIHSLSVRLLPVKQAAPGPHFHTKSSGGSITFVHPLTGRQHTLTIQEYSQERMEHLAFHNPEKQYPDCFSLIGYTIHPALSPDQLIVTDCAESDSPRTLQTYPPTAAPTDYSESDIIGGADGPAVLFLSKPAQSGSLHYAASAVHFEPRNETEWRIMFYEQVKSEIHIDLI